jgi:hypothetical protein
MKALMPGLARVYLPMSVPDMAIKDARGLDPAELAHLSQVSWVKTVRGQRGVIKLIA